MKETFYATNCPLRVALLADLHNKPYKSVIESLECQKPEMIAISGDVIFQYTVRRRKSVLEKQHNVLPFLSACAEIAPTYFSLGNHERILDRDELDVLRHTGITILDNQWVRQKDVIIGGLTSGYVMEYRTYKKNRKKKSVKPLKNRYPIKGAPLGTLGKTMKYPPDLSWLSEFIAQEGYKILLCHHPEYLPILPESIDLILAGHAHGGQIRIFGQGLYAPGQGWFPKLTSGIHEGRLVISRGLSNTAHFPRFFNSKEVVYTFENPE